MGIKKIIRLYETYHYSPTIVHVIKIAGIGLVSAAVVAISIQLTVVSHAATTFVGSEAETGMLASPASVVTDTTASSGKAVVFGTSASATPPQVGFDWPAAGRVYVAHWTQQSVTSADPSRAFRIAEAHNIHLVRVFLGDDVVIGDWKNNPTDAMNGIQKMFDDANANNVKLIISTYLTQQTMQVLAGHSYASWSDAQKDLINPSSTAYNELGKWDEAVIGQFGSNPAAYSWEVTNEPNWMLGIDSGTVSRDDGYTFLDHFQQLLHRDGAKLVNGGGEPLYDPSLLTDTQLKTYAAHLDILDNHIYPSYDNSGTPLGGTTEAQAAIDATNTYYQRVRSLTGRLKMPAMLGEFGTLQPTWFQSMAQQSMDHGWNTIAWGFDAYDQYDFNDMTRPEVLSLLAKLTPQ